MILVVPPLDVSQQPAMGYMEIVQQRDAPTLLPIIQAHTQAGTTIHSDQWAAYRNVRTLPGIASYQTVKESPSAESLEQQIHEVS